MRNMGQNAELCFENARINGSILPALFQSEPHHTVSRILVTVRLNLAYIVSKFEQIACVSTTRDDIWTLPFESFT